jgi:hypothetical protein
MQRNIPFFCNKCQTQKASEDFHANKNSVTGRASYCKICSKILDRAKYQKRWEQFQCFLVQLRIELGSGCKVCGRTDYVEFAHRDPSSKKYTIADGKNVYVKEYILREEALKCDLLCRYHHLEQTKQQYQGQQITRSPRKEKELTGKMACCSLCEEVKDTSLFFSDCSKPSGHASYCAECGRNMKTKARREVKEYKDSKKTSCMDCGATAALEFDHVSGTKKYTVSQMQFGGSTLDAEIAKCDVVCHTCHRLRTQARKEVMSSDDQ